MVKKLDISALIIECLKIHNCANENLKQLNGYCDQKEDVRDYFLGIIRRQAILTFDLKIILEKSPNIITPSIICRCLMDDFLHLFYIIENSNMEENIVKINAEAFFKNFESLEGLTKSNHQHFKGQYPHYLKGADFKKIKNTFSTKKENKKFFKNAQEFIFKTFITNAELINGIKDSELNKLAQRAFFMWKNFSSFIDYSNLTFDYETQSNKEVFYAHIEETLLYTYNTIKWSFDFFEKRDNLKFINSGLDEEYKILRK